LKILLPQLEESGVTYAPPATTLCDSHMQPIDERF
jgi:hypothetical protein